MCLHSHTAGLMEHTVIILLAVLLLAPCIVQTATLSEVTTRADETFRGFLHYYWRHDPSNKTIGFFFACGQVGGMGTPDVWNECGCYTPDRCTNCYRWWDAVALEAVANYGIYTKTKTYKYIPDAIFPHSPYNAKWNATSDCTFVDDFSWYGIAYLRVYEWLQDVKWLEVSVDIYNWTWQYGWDNECGGFWWMTCVDQHYKDSITIVEVLHFGAKLAYMFPQNMWYLKSAQKIWDWIFSFNDGYGLMTDKYLMSTGAVPEQCCNNTISDPIRRCVNSNVSGTSYNQGLLMSAAAYLYNRTGNKTYLNVGLRALEAILTNYTTKDGIILDEARGYRTYQYGCYGWADPGGDWYSFQGVFINHLSYFTTVLADSGVLPLTTQERIMKFVELTSDAAWTKSAVRPPFKKDDVCNINPNEQNITYPKFHWWWNEDTTNQQILPPDPQLFFHKTYLRCYTQNGNDTQIWEGMIGSEDKCKAKCARNPNCSKYLYQTDQSAVPGTDCWIWSYNRSNHICHKGDTDFNVGIKRPIGHASCAGRCGSKDPIKLEHGVCYCDDICVNHLDCCLDYANHCTSGAVPSCKGQCNKFVPRPVPWGGYCWCFDGCNPWYTDNNSAGSCCPDYNEECLQVTMPMCMDARSQGSALNLFIAHLRLSQRIKPNL